MKSIRAIQSSSGAFAAIKCDGTVVTWGYRIYGGDSSAIQEHLIQVEQIQSTSNLARLDDFMFSHALRKPINMICLRLDVVKHI